MRHGDEDRPSADVARIRREYRSAGLSPGDLDPDPMVAFRRWLDDAVAAGLAEPTAMVLATVGTSGMPSVRAVLLKGYDARGFVFFTNRRSAKATDIAGSPLVALEFPWVDLHRQVIVRGSVEAVDEGAADRYFAGRPRGSQLGAWASAQSEVIADRAVLDEALTAAAQRFAGGPVPRPPFWGGYRVVPVAIEFWQGRPDRLHDRIRFRREAGDSVWVMERLSP